MAKLFDWVGYMRSQRLRSGAVPLPLNGTPEASYADVQREAGSVNAYRQILAEREAFVARGGELAPAGTVRSRVPE